MKESSTSVTWFGCVWIAVGVMILTIHVSELGYIHSLRYLNNITIITYVFITILMKTILTNNATNVYKSSVHSAI